MSRRELCTRSWKKLWPCDTKPAQKFSLQVQASKMQALWLPGASSEVVDPASSASSRSTKSSTSCCPRALHLMTCLLRRLVLDCHSGDMQHDKGQEERGGRMRPRPSLPSRRCPRAPRAMRVGFSQHVTWQTRPPCPGAQPRRHPVGHLSCLAPVLRPTSATWQLQAS